MAIVPCPKTWELPFPSGYFPDLEALHHQCQVKFFSKLLPGIVVKHVKPMYRMDRPRCSWQVSCEFQDKLDHGLADHIYNIVESNKYANVVIEPIIFYNPHNFSVVYNINCECDPADFLLEKTVTVH